jgi:methyltransferase (TIGR00027 family)
VGVAAARGIHRSSDQPPWVLDDPFALPLAGPGWGPIMAASRAAFRPAAVRQSRASIVARSRYAEDRLLTGGYRQYVILGAGLDSFAWRRADQIGWLRLFEVDRPASQARKLARITELGLPVQDGHVFAAVDFETESLRDGLDRAGLDWSQPTFFSCLGVLIYLTAEAIVSTLRIVRECGVGSEIVVSYDVPDAFLDDIAREMVAIEASQVAAVGEPYTTRMSPAQAEELCRSAGLEVAEHLTTSAIYDRYFAERSDGLRPSTAERLIAARAELPHLPGAILGIRNLTRQRKSAGWRTLRGGLPGGRAAPGSSPRTTPAHQPNHSRTARAGTVHPRGARVAGQDQRSKQKP